MDKCYLCPSLASALVLLLALSSSAGAFGYGDATGNGSTLPGIDPLSMGMGGARAINPEGPTSIFLNPARMSSGEGTALFLGGGPAIVSETVEDSTGKYKRSYAGLGQICLAAGTGLTGGISGGLGVARVTDHTYDGVRFLDEDPENPGVVTDIEYFDSAGGLWEAVGGLAFRATEWLDVGASVGGRFGSYDYTFTHQDLVEGTSTDSTGGWDESGLCWHAGASARFEWIALGTSYAAGDDRYPSRFALGGLIYTDPVGNQALGLEFEVASIGGDRCYTGRLVGQFSLSKSLRLRAGCFLIDRPALSESESVGLAGGGRIGWGDLGLEFSLAWLTDKRDEPIFRLENAYYVSDNPALVAVGLDWRI
ncbi:hypothetical protein GF402_06810 [Candidatus Fermentibacteria bacterium]|nr:hypothetical protein [Candidatus Fermentibacteria bacterium]